MWKAVTCATYRNYPAPPSWKAQCPTAFQTSLANHLCGPYNWITWSHGYNAIMVSSGPPVQTCSCHTDNVRCYGIQSRLAVQRPHLEAPQTPRRSYQQLRNPIHIELHTQPQPTPENQNHSFHHLSSTDEWADRVGQPRGQTIPKTLHESTPIWLGWMAVYSQVCL